MPSEHYAPGTLCPRNTMPPKHYASGTLCLRNTMPPENYGKKWAPFVVPVPIHPWRSTMNPLLFLHTGLHPDI